MLEPYEWKRSRTVLREESGSNSADLLDYFPLVKRLNGTAIKVSPNSRHYLNPMDIVIHKDDEENPVILKADFILSLCDLIIGGKDGLQPIEKTVIDRCVHLVYKNYLADPKPENMPILSTLWELLKTQPEAEAKNLATALELYVIGSLNIFNNRTNVDINNRIVCFDIKELGKELKIIGMLIVQDAVWNRVSVNRSKGIATNYYIDEFHLLLKEPQTASYMVEIWKRFRKWGGIPTGITQNVSDFLSNPNSAAVESILSNTPFIRMLEQTHSDASILSRFLDISEDQMGYVDSPPVGHGLLKCGGTILPFSNRLPKDNVLYPYITTKPSEQ